MVVGGSKAVVLVGPRVNGFHKPGEELGGGDRVPRGRHGVALDGGVVVGTHDELAALGSVLTLVHDQGRAADGWAPRPETEIVRQAADAAMRFDPLEVRRLLRQLPPAALARLAVAMRDMAGLAVVMIEQEARD